MTKMTKRMTIEKLAQMTQRQFLVIGQEFAAVHRKFATVHQEFAAVRSEMGEGFKAMNEKMDAGFAAMLDRMDAGFASMNLKFLDLDTRATTIERRLKIKK